MMISGWTSGSCGDIGPVREVELAVADRVADREYGVRDEPAVDVCRLCASSIFRSRAVMGGAEVDGGALVAGVVLVPLTWACCNS